jgi:4'-phosphopantetheinyl transferase
VARGTLRTLLARYLGKQPKELQFVFGREGKPALVPEPAERILSFNLSHSQDIGIFAFGWNRNIGVDVERVRADVECEDIARHYFSAQEIKSLARLPPQKRTEGFFLCWTRKEAYIKARGGGLQIPLDSFDVSLEPGTPARFLGGVDPSWRISSFVADHEHPAALVCDGPSVDLRFFIVDRDMGGNSDDRAG